MADNTVNHAREWKAEVQTKQLHASVVLKIRPGQEAAAMEAAKTDGADNVFFQVGHDTYVASARKMNLKDLKCGDLIAFNNQEATIVAVDDVLKGAGDGWRASKGAAHVTSIGTGFASAAGTAAFYIKHPYEVNYRVPGHTLTTHLSIHPDKVAGYISGWYSKVKRIGIGEAVGRGALVGLGLGALAYGITKVGGAIYGTVRGISEPDFGKLKAFAE